MNLLDIHCLDWSQECLDACGPDLRQILGPAIPSPSILGPISEYMADRFGFESSCQIVAFTGDNPSSLSGMALQPGELCISLGTSDTVMAWLNADSVEPQLIGHIWPNPVDTEAYMALLW